MPVVGAQDNQLKHQHRREDYRSFHNTSVGLPNVLPWQKLALQEVSAQQVHSTARHGTAKHDTGRHAVAEQDTALVKAVLSFDRATSKNNQF